MTSSLIFANRPLIRTLALVSGVFLSLTSSRGEEAEWIWSPEHEKEAVPEVACHFRKAFNANPERGEVTIAADDRYELFVNGRRVGAGESARQLDKHDITKFLARGKNLISVKVMNQSGSTAALAARVMIKDKDGEWVNHSTDATWKTSLRVLPLWNLPVYNDNRWLMAQSFGALGSTIPWDRDDDVAEDEQQNHERFKINREFEVQRVIGDEHTGSLIAMTFNEFGHAIASREGGPLLLITDTNEDQIPDKVRTYCDKVKNCQGILPLNGDVFVTGDGPEGNALYRLSDQDRDGSLEEVVAVLKFTGDVGEHGPHGIVLGPDGMIYVIVGNHSEPENGYADSSPHHNYYEGDLVLPRYEDPGGHAVGKKAPGGVVLRVNLDGSKVEMVCGGLRNAYDLAFNQDGDLFVHDSDMESDIGMSWYRPTQVFHIIPGGEYGWRSGWAKWPDYFVDNLPGILDTGRGSPTGAVVYNHVAFPTRYHNALFLGDWSEGRILAVTTKRSGATYTANSEVFLQGEPLNVTDLEVGPDGSLYFVTGGRGTGGGMYRITWRGKVPDSVTKFSDDLNKLIRHPQLHSAWGRQELAALKVKLGDEWDRSVIGVAASPANPPHYRTRALDLMQLFGPLPTTDLLVALANDKNETVRARVAMLMGLHPDEATRAALVTMLKDSDRTVRRRACESLVRVNEQVPFDAIESLLTSDDRFEAWSARRLLESTDVLEWNGHVLATDDQRAFIQGATALLIAHPDKQYALDVVARTSKVMQGFVSDREFIDMLRLLQIAMIRGNLAPSEVPELQLQIADEFPSGNSPMNRELARLLGYLQVSSIADRYLAYLKSPDVSNVDKLHLAAHLRFVKEGWTSKQRIELLEFFSDARQLEGGPSFAHYVMNVSRDFAKLLHEDDYAYVLANAQKWPDAALGILYKLPKQLDPETLDSLTKMDRQLVGEQDKSVKSLKVGVVAVLARSGDEQSMEYLREIWENDPQRRSAVAMGLAQQPEGENWPYLIRSLPVVEGPIARDVLAKLQTVNQRPQGAEHYRQVILKGLALKEAGADQAVALLEHWMAEKLPGSEEGWEAGIAAWQAWYVERYPDKPEAKLPVDSEDAKWNFDQLLKYLASDEAATASVERGAVVFNKVQCANCHRFEGKGEIMGPDLTALSKRFTRKEILQSIIYPSHTISDQYASKMIITKDGLQYTGIVAPGAAGEKIVLQADGKKIVIEDEQIDEIAPSRQSSMPDGLLDSLEVEEIADLFRYLGAAPRPAVARQPRDEVQPRQ